MLPNRSIARFRLGLPFGIVLIYSMVYWRQKPHLTYLVRVPRKRFSAGTLRTLWELCQTTGFHGIKDGLPLVTAFSISRFPLCPSEGAFFLFTLIFKDSKLSIKHFHEPTRSLFLLLWKKTLGQKSRTLSANPQNLTLGASSVGLHLPILQIIRSSDCFSIVALQLCYLLGQCFLSATSFLLTLIASLILQEHVCLLLLWFPLLSTFAA